MTSDAAIIRILNEQLSAYKLLHDLLNRERSCLIDFDGKRVEEISKEKDTVIMRLRLLEDERQRLIKQFVEDRGISSDVSLEEIGKITGNNTYLELRSQLLSLLQCIEEMNKFNAVLIDRSIHYIRTTSGFFNAFGSDPVPHTSGVFLSKET